MNTHIARDLGLRACDVCIIVTQQMASDPASPALVDCREGTAAIAYEGYRYLEAIKDAVHYNRFLLREITNLARLNEEIVDFGAGDGMFAIPLHQQGYKPTCVEIDPGLMAHLRNSGLRVVDSLSSIPNDSVDFLYSFNVLEHIKDDQSMLAEWVRKLRPGGTLLLYVPAFQNIYNSMDLQSGHYRRYRLRPLRAQVSAAGFTVDRIRYVDSIGILAAVAYKVVDNGAGTISPRAVRVYDKYLFGLSSIMDPFLGRFIGKNLMVLAHKPPQNEDTTVGG